MLVPFFQLATVVRTECDDLQEDVLAARAQQNVSGPSGLLRLDPHPRVQESPDRGKPGLDERMRQPLRRQVVARIPANRLETGYTILDHELEAGPPANRLDEGTCTPSCRQGQGRRRPTQTRDTRPAGIGLKGTIQPPDPEERRQVSHGPQRYFLARRRQVVSTGRIPEPGLLVNLPLAAIDRSPCISLGIVHAPMIPLPAVIGTTLPETEQETAA